MAAWAELPAISSNENGTLPERSFEGRTALQVNEREERRVFVFSTGKASQCVGDGGNGGCLVRSNSY
jgi:hypothetical protein